MNDVSSDASGDGDCGCGAMDGSPCSRSGSRAPSSSSPNQMVLLMSDLGGSAGIGSICGRVATRDAVAAFIKSCEIGGDEEGRDVRLPVRLRRELCCGRTLRLLEDKLSIFLRMHKKVTVTCMRPPKGEGREGERNTKGERTGELCPEAHANAVDPVDP